MQALRVKEIDSVVITEGAISAVMAGVDAVATYGKYVGPEQVEMLIKLQSVTDRPVKYLVALDGDALNFSQKLARSLYERGLETYLVNLPLEHDPASLPREQWKTIRNSPIPYEGRLSEVEVGLKSIQYKDRDDDAFS
jgi:DNA primase